ncbi:hypothetical protein SSX86_017393 [Deinandra increscens subsp. villosa]|uniref:Uncharacterized protein n=1 Tax=Deinandra increscens subsp. villosa TaxID=3103831 RepID=A0AAP0GU75_9ASTR
MQTKKVAMGRNSSKAIGSPKVSRNQKVTEDVNNQENNVSQIITSSARKQKPAVTRTKNSKENVDVTNLNATICSDNDSYLAINNMAVDSEGCNVTETFVNGTIFSPTFHISRAVEGEVTDGDLGCGLSSEVSAIYQCMKDSKLECVDEDDHDHTSSDVQMDDEEYVEFDEFDPYFFIKNLPELASVVPSFRQVLLPKQTRSCPPTTLVLDLDETLVHSTLEPCEDADFTFSVNFNLEDHKVYVRCRPYLKEFMERVAGLFEIIIFTASQSIYAEQLLNVLDPKRKVFRHRVYRESCVFLEGNYLKDLSVLGRDLARVVMIDNSPQAFGFQVDNGIPIESWFDDRSDQELLLLLPFLESLVGVEDVRPLIIKKFNLREKIAAAICPLAEAYESPHRLLPRANSFTPHAHTFEISNLSPPALKMVVAQKMKEAEITEQDSLLLTRNLLRIAIFNISYIRGLFPEKYFSDKGVPALEMKIKKLMPMDAESRRLIDWMEKGIMKYFCVYDALQKKYLRTLMFCVCETAEGPMIEEYSFSFSYSNSDSQEVSMNVNRIGNKKRGETFKCDSTTEITPTQMKSSACKMVRTLIQLMRTLDKMPEERTIVMKLLYYDDVTPADYEPPFFRGCTEEETHNAWTKNPLKMEVGNVNSKHFVLSLKVKSVLDPCEDDNVSLGGDSMQQDGDSEADSEASISDDEYIVAPIDKQKEKQDDTMVDEDDTEDPAEDEQQLNRVREWIKSHHQENVDFTDVLSSFPDISLVLLEETMDKLVTEGILVKAGNESFTIRRPRNMEYEFDAVKEETDARLAPGKKSLPTTGETHMYMKALYHALPMNYITVSKLQSKLGGEANQITVRKLMDKMTKEGYIESTSNRRLGKRVVHSDITKKKLAEVQKALDMDAMVLDIYIIIFCGLAVEDANETHNKSNHSVNQAGTNGWDTSTLGGLHSIGSDLTRTKGRSDLHQNGSTFSDATVTRLRENGHNTPTSNTQPIASIESHAAAGAGMGETGNVNLQDDKMDTVVCSGRSTLDKHSRKASTVKEPILQYLKRQKSQ